MRLPDGVDVEFSGSVPKQPMPLPAEVDDQVTVDFDAGLNQIVVLGYVGYRGADSKHELRLDEVHIEWEEPDREVGTLTVSLRVHRRDSGGLVMTGRKFFPYRLHLEIEPPLPQWYVVKHFDEDGEKQFEGAELFMSDLGIYQKMRFE